MLGPPGQGAGPTGPLGRTVAELRKQPLHRALMPRMQCPVDGTGVPLCWDSTDLGCTCPSGTACNKGTLEAAGIFNGKAYCTVRGGSTGSGARRRVVEVASEQARRRATGRRPAPPSSPHQVRDKSRLPPLLRAPTPLPPTPLQSACDDDSLCASNSPQNVCSGGCNDDNTCNGSPEGHCAVRLPGGLHHASFTGTGRLWGGGEGAVFHVQGTRRSALWQSTAAPLPGLPSTAVPR